MVGAVLVTWWTTVPLSGVGFPQNANPVTVTTQPWPLVARQASERGRHNIMNLTLTCQSLEETRHVVCHVILTWELVVQVLVTTVSDRGQSHHSQWHKSKSGLLQFVIWVKVPIFSDGGQCQHSQWQRSISGLLQSVIEVKVNTSNDRGQGLDLYSQL